jgi:hypothetical protein
MLRLVIDIIDDRNDALSTKEAVAMALEQFGRVHIISATSVDGKGREKQWTYPR